MPDPGENQFVGQIRIGARTEDIVGAEADPGSLIAIG